MVESDRIGIGSVTLRIKGEVVTVHYPIPVFHEPVDVPMAGAFGYPGDEWIRFVHDNLNPEWGYITRVVNKTLKMTNETLVPKEWIASEQRVQPHGKVTYWPEALSPEWQAFFFHLMTQRQKDRFNGEAFGWRDGADGGLHPYSVLPCGGFLGKVAGYWENFTLLYAMDVDKPPNDPDELKRLGISSMNDHFDAPFFWTKQGLTGAGKNGPYYGIVDRNTGDLYPPFACHGGIIAIENKFTRSIPSLPFVTTFTDDTPVTFTQYNFSGPDTVGMATDGKWYYIQKSTIPGVGNQTDTVTLVNGWCPVLPISIVGYQQEYVLTRLMNFVKGILS